MSFAELKDEVPRLSDAQLEELAACVRLARIKRDPAWLERAERINAEMDRGRAYGEEDLLRLHTTLLQEGR